MWMLQNLYLKLSAFLTVTETNLAMKKQFDIVVSHYRQLTCIMMLAVGLATQNCAQSQETVAFYFSAHEDDWQLFMNPNAYHDVHRPATKVVFVYLTAGDAGAGLGNAEHAEPYYKARENGAKLSVSFMVDAKSRPGIPVSSAASFSGHPLVKWTYKNTVSYF